MSNMLEQAIVDAKALRDAAFKSAQDALLEKYTPEIKKAVNTLLEVDEPDEMDSLFAGTGQVDGDKGEGEMSGVVDNIPLAASEGEKLCPCPDDEEEIEIDFAALEKQMMAGDEGEPSIGHQELAGDLGIENSEEEFNLEESDLYEMIRESMKNPSEESEQENEEEKIEEACDDEMTESEKPSAGLSKKQKSDVVKKAKAGEDIGKKGKSFKDVAKKAEKSGASDPEAVAAAAMWKNIKKESLDINAQIQKTVLSEMKKTENTLIKENKKLLSEREELFKSNNELKLVVENMKGKVKEITDTLKELNLDNAKLLYTNQVLKSTSLNERQKTKIVEAISRAGSVDEAKVVYETLVDSVGSYENKRPESLNEAVLTNRNNFFKRQSTKAVNPEKERWRALAGITKK